LQHVEIDKSTNPINTSLSTARWRAALEL
jgi:hypothetical protein